MGTTRMSNIESMNIGIPKGGIGSLFGAAKQIKVVDVKTSEPFVSLFRINEDVLESLTDNMIKHGFDKNYPIVIWKEKDVLIDGHTRLKACQNAGIESIPAFYESFSCEDAVLDYMYNIQFSRRNVNDSELIYIVRNLLSTYVKQYGGGTKLEHIKRRLTALSDTKAKKIIYLIDNADENLINSVENQVITINKAYQLAKKVQLDLFEKKASDDTFDDGCEDTVRCDDRGVFYYRNFSTRTEYKAFELPVSMNTARIRTRIQEVLKEELG